MKGLEKAGYIVNLVISTLCLFPLIYLTWLFFIPAYGFAIYNYVASKGTKYRTLSLVIMICMLVGLVPVIGYITRIVAGAFIIVLIVKHWKK